MNIRINSLTLHNFKGVRDASFSFDGRNARIEGENGQQFVRVNQQVLQQDPMGNLVQRTLNDLSQGEFDVVISDVEASTTQRKAQLWSLVDAVSKMGIPGDLVFDQIIELSDLPNKQDIKQRWMQQQQAQQQAQQAQLPPHCCLVRLRANIW